VDLSDGGCIGLVAATVAILLIVALLFVDRF
jgi:hypothetical protein